MAKQVADDERLQEVSLKVGRVRELMLRRGLDTFVLSTQASVAWLGAGLTDRVLRDRQESLVWIAVTRDDLHLISWDTEKVRLEMEEDILALGLTPHYVAWTEDSMTSVVRGLSSGGRMGGDQPWCGLDCSLELRSLRSRLLPEEGQRLRSLSVAVTSEIERVLRSVRPGIAERDVAGSIAGKLEALGIRPLVLLVGSGDRLVAFRHWVPTKQPIERQVIVTVAAENGGLVTVVTRTLWFCVDDEIRSRQDQVMAVAAAAAASSRVGSFWGAALDEAVGVYEAQGNSGEWRRHFQGGVLGYDTREFSPKPSSEPNRWSHERIAADQAFAWNPTLAGVKSEDTYLVTSKGPALLTRSGEWPTVRLKHQDVTVEVPDALVA